MKRAVIIDDNEGVIEALQAALELLEFDCIGIQTNEHTEIVDRVADSRPDIIFLDMLLSGTDGETVSRALREAEALQSTPIILMSAHPNGLEISRKIRVDGFLPKPFSLDILGKVIKKIGVKTGQEFQDAS